MNEGNLAVAAREPRPRADGRNSLLAALPAAEAALLQPHLIDTVLASGDVLQEVGQPIRRVYFPQGGLVSLLGVLPSGQAIDTALIGREGAIGLSAGLGSPTALSRAVVQLPGPAVSIASARLAEAAERSKAVRDMIVAYASQLMAQVQYVAVCSTVHHVDVRFCRWLLQAHDRIDGDTVPLTQEFLSGLMGVQRTTVTAICRMLQAEKIIDVRRGRIQIRNPEALRHKTCACYGLMSRLTEPAAA
jgi:CRP-like cAMP-binding protein